MIQRKNHSLIVCGKKYFDTIIETQNIQLNETNYYTSLQKIIGGYNNFNEVNFLNYTLHCHRIGLKKAYIICDIANSTRMSFVKNTEASIISKKDIEYLNTASWVHFAYIDDFEDYLSVQNIVSNFSLDFCTSSADRTKFIQLINQAKIIFDSRERKNMYCSIRTKTPIIFHDPFGVEIVVDGNSVCCVENIPIEGLNVNGAGDILAGFIIDQWGYMYIKDNLVNAILKTKNKLINRNNHEKI